MSETWKPGPWTLNGKATNASLLDAAQDLYEALIELLNAEDYSERVSASLTAREALAKARGE